MFDIDELPPRIREKIRVLDSGCWEWIAATSPAGYGKVAWEGHVTEAHRVVYTLLAGPIPAGLVIDHLCHDPSVCTAKGRECRHRRCQNPGHVRVTTRGSNALRSYSPPAINAEKTVCDAGHEYTDESTVIDGGTRRCLLCRREADKRRRPAGVARKGRVYKGPRRGANGETPERRAHDEQIVRLRSDGLSWRAISEQIGKSQFFVAKRFEIATAARQASGLGRARVGA